MFTPSSTWTSLRWLHDVASNCSPESCCHRPALSCAPFSVFLAYAGYTVGVVKAVLSGDTLVLMGAAKSGPPPELQVTLSSIQAPVASRHPEKADDVRAQEARDWRFNLLVLVNFLSDCAAFRLGCSRIPSQVLHWQASPLSSGVPARRRWWFEARVCCCVSRRCCCSWRLRGKPVRASGHASVSCLIRLFVSVFFACLI